MNTVFLSILNMSLHGSVVLAVVLLLRALFCKAPKAFAVAAWAIAAVRLVCPIVLTSAFSLMPSLSETPGGPDTALTLTVLEETLSLPVTAPIEYGTPWVSVGAIVWCAGVAGMALYTLAAYRRTHKTLREAVLLEKNVYECDRIPTPFIFGFFHPRVYVPSSMAVCDRRYVIAHEFAHIARWDHLWKPLGFAVLALHWFNPLVWIAYVLFCRDMETACDERVLCDLGADSKKAYADVLINCAAPTRRIAACPLAFGETNVKARVRKVLRYQKPAQWITAAAVLVCLCLAVCFLTDPKVQALEPHEDVPAPSTTQPTTTPTTPFVPTVPTLPQYTQKMTVEAITPRAVAVGDTVTVRVSVQDSRGLQSGVEILLYRETEDGLFLTVGNAVKLTLVQGTEADGVYEGAIVVESGTAAGDYRLRATYIPVSEKPAVCTAYTPEGEAAVTVQ